MKFSIKLPFSEVVFKNAGKGHKRYFEKLFFKTKSEDVDSRYKIVVNFKKIRLSDEDTMYLEEDVAAQDGNLYIFDTKQNKLELNFDLFKKNRVDISVESDFDLYFLYNNIIEPILIIWAARHGILYIHSSAIEKKGEAYVFAAWRHTGKTSSIFSLSSENIKFMGDDFCVLHDSRVYIYPKYINIFSYNFQTYPWLYDVLPPLMAIRIKLSAWLKSVLFYVSQRLSKPLSKIFFRLSELAEVSTNTKVTPDQLNLKIQAEAPLHKVVFITKGEGQSTKARELATNEIKRKLLAITLYEIRDFLSVRSKASYLFPKKAHNIIDSFEQNYLKAIGKNIDKAEEVFIEPMTNKDAFVSDLSLLIKDTT